MEDMTTREARQKVIRAGGRVEIVTDTEVSSFGCEVWIDPVGNVVHPDTGADDMPVYGFGRFNINRAGFFVDLFDAHNADMSPAFAGLFFYMPAATSSLRFSHGHPA